MKIHVWIGFIIIHNGIANSKILIVDEIEKKRSLYQLNANTNTIKIVCKECYNISSDYVSGFEIDNNKLMFVGVSHINVNKLYMSVLYYSGQLLIESDIPLDVHSRRLSKYNTLSGWINESPSDSTDDNSDESNSNDDSDSNYDSYSGSHSSDDNNSDSDSNGSNGSKGSDSGYYWVSSTRNPTTKPTQKPTKKVYKHENKKGKKKAKLWKKRKQPTFKPTIFQTNNQSTSPTKKPTQFPSKNPSLMPTLLPINNSRALTTNNPSEVPTESPTKSPSTSPTISLTLTPTFTPTTIPSITPTSTPTLAPSITPTKAPTLMPTNIPTGSPSIPPTLSPSNSPTIIPTVSPIINCPDISEAPSEEQCINAGCCYCVAGLQIPSTGNSICGFPINSTACIDDNIFNCTAPDESLISSQTNNPTISPTFNPTELPTKDPTFTPTITPSISTTVTFTPATFPTRSPTIKPTLPPTFTPTVQPTKIPSMTPTKGPTFTPTITPSKVPTITPTRSPLGINETYSPSETPTISPSISPTVDCRTFGGFGPSQDECFDGGCCFCGPGRIAIPFPGTTCGTPINSSACVEDAIFSCIVPEQSSTAKHKISKLILSKEFTNNSSIIELGALIEILIAFIFGGLCSIISILIIYKCINRCKKRKNNGYIAVNVDSTTDGTLTEASIKI